MTKSISITTFNNDALKAIDFRPATGNLYALGGSGRFYILNQSPESNVACARWRI
jgi:Domain of unknown function (DUF4394)